MDILDRLRSSHPGSQQAIAGSTILVDAANEIERLRDAKRRALQIADERAKENVRLRAALVKIRDALSVLGRQTEIFEIASTALDNEQNAQGGKDADRA